ncbi:AbrB/MazE/SpoVT family DNA-binding domain-containing protein [Brenneria sp. WC1b.1]|uniref:AbrB/MazE/SpoVT family DNA-binding domain-containing protein n=1 Tax=Brenneria tiliae TaxID=2914984 RepID=A0ABT0MQ12_9GAMM|nr:AbrB/MazE/SpoVT family DNA-binding domain-containing protein [Brenneria tiliae]MCL2891926.1 AbrB/MazE/SpoVT family DNA-binding domain-containing protein [Brenneria tiliae]MCL2897027.1 AbrB/MazE/SpoVT family DNA-binding domain-containing protein [Brenneria tiliae]MCL2901578.1 AbrB/MazE/SpoVT family DNA-binding domain-containing protein [Brenneria tiliae]
MEHVIRLSRDGKHQVVILPAEFAFDADWVYIRRDREGNVILSKKSVKPDTWDNVLRLIQEANVPDTFLSQEKR